MRVHKNIRRLLYGMQGLILIAMPILLTMPARAAYLTRRTIAVDNPIASAVTNYKASFNLSTAANLGSISLIFCDNSPLADQPCTPPPGMAINTATLSLQTGEGSFSIDPSSTASTLLLTRAATPALTGPVSYTFTGVTNPSTPNNTIYMRIFTYPTTDASGPETDKGAAAFSTSGTFGTAAFVPPHLDFCVGVTVDSQCASTAGSAVSFGDINPSGASSVTTQCAAATNDPTGYRIYSLGSTMTSGNNLITAMGSPNPSIAGFSQFGINMRSNNNPNKGQNISGVGSGTPLPDYNTPDIYKFSSGAAVAESTQATDYNVYTTTYISNVPPSQPIGVYNTTITYMAVAQF